ncbi:phage tail sheath protein [Bacillus cereus]|uniref:phage tail sheath protein n=1 Tax=Bacillus cereus TaxID=1396 RepID=UPI000BF9FB58|nr:phage tail sheath protein [Bacillus cereus]PFB64464.1 phage tail sheath protein [Bacillus cereus]PFP65348.1 phage tail sheath protein [Bacillus cereus]PGT10094.1 phage tail sheath protein [Bacillus cereus]
MLYENLPGINVTLKDGGLIIPERGGSESILIIAPSLAKDAPEEPVLIRSSSELVQAGFGDFYVAGEVNPIAAEWKAATDGGARMVYLVALKEISTERATELEQFAIDAYVAAGNTLQEAEAKFKNVLVGTTEAVRVRRKFIYFYDLLMSDLLDFTVDHVVLKGVTLEDEATNLVGEFFPEVPNSEDFPYISGMVTSSYVMESNSIVYPVEITTGTNDKLVVKVDGKDVTFTLPAKTYNGSTLTISDLVKDIKTVIEADPTGIKANVREDSGKIVLYFDAPASVQAGTTATGLQLSNQVAKWQKTSFGVIHRGSFAQTVADYCSMKTLMKSAAIGYIGVKSPVDTKVSTIRKYVDELAKLDTEISPYLQVVGSEVGVIMPTTNSMHYVNGATHYAALLSTLRKESAPTNKPIKGVKAIRFDYSLRQLSKLTSKKIVTFRLKDSTQLVVTDGITTAPSIFMAGKVRESDFARLSTLRITQLAIQVVREAVEPFIGEANEMPQYNAMNTAIKSALEKIREAGAIQGYKFTIGNLGVYLDEATVTLEIIPAFELRRVEVQVNLAPPEYMLQSLGQ